MTGQPNDQKFQESHKRAFDLLMKLGDDTNWTPQELKHKRGSGFAAINVGLTYGNGHTKPSRPNLGRHQKLADALLADKDLQRLAAYQDGECSSRLLFQGLT